MGRKFAEIAFTPSVRAAQEHYGSRAANEGFETADDPRNTLTEAEIEFIGARDSFYQATVSEGGWPYVQFRGGPAGFLKVLDERTLGYADFRGNVQYLSVGNLAANDRIGLILMDYPNRRRLKIWARVRVVDYADDPELVSRLEIPTYRARVERGMVLTVEALDWNCPQHITPRFTEAEVGEMVAPLQARLAELEAEAVDRPAGADRQTWGDGPLELVIAGIRQLTPEVRAYELRRPDLNELPEIAAGAHIELPVPFGDGPRKTRFYSISSDPDRRDAWEIAVRREPEGDGGSRAIHAHYALGRRLRVGQPRNAFGLHDDPRPAVLIAGGIGITPLRSMSRELQAAGRDFHLHYAGRSRAHMAFAPELAQALAGAVTFYPGDEGRRPDLAALMAAAPDDAVFYACGPGRLIDALREEARALGIADERVRFERFAAPESGTGDTAFEVHLARSDRTLRVGPDQTVLDALLDAGVEANYSCQAGTCGTCAVGLLEGTPEHRDGAFSEAERGGADRFRTCVSRAASPRLVLDI